MKAEPWTVRLSQFKHNRAPRCGRPKGGVSHKQTKADRGREAGMFLQTSFMDDVFLIFLITVPWWCFDVSRLLHSCNQAAVKFEAGHLDSTRLAPALETMAVISPASILSKYFFNQSNH